MRKHHELHQLHLHCMVLLMEESCTSWYGKYPIIYKALEKSQVVVWDFWSITSINTLEKKPFLLPWTTSVGFWRAVGPQVPVRHLRSRQVSRAGKERKKGNPFLAAKRRYTPHCCDIIPAESGNCAHISKEIDHRLFISIYIYMYGKTVDIDIYIIYIYIITYIYIYTLTSIVGCHFTLVFVNKNSIHYPYYLVQ